VAAVNIARNRKTM